MDRTEFMSLVYDELQSDADNNRSNRIIDAADEYAESMMSRWIPVTERLPDPRIDVWCNSDLGQMVGYYEEHVGTWYGRDYLELIVTAWMPLPEPYREEVQE